LAAIMFTDMVGYTALGQRNESLSLALVEEQRKLIRPILTRHNGREIKTIGDAFLVDFPNALDAVRCAYDIQRAVREFNISLPEERRVHLRVGVHLGDVVESGGDISGDAVNVASRIEPLAEDGGVCVTRQVYDHVQNKFELKLASLGVKTLKNVSVPIEVYKMLMPWSVETSASSTQLDKKRIAVLPFANMSSNPEDGYFADGMTEELITSLSGVRQLAVIARTSVMKYKGSQKDASDVGKELNAGTLIEGSVRKAGNKVRITTQLIDTSTESHIWAQNYDRNLDDVFAIQSEIAEKVAGELKIRLVDSEKRVIEKKPTENTEAYTYFLRGRELLREQTDASLKQAIALFEKAIELDPNFARAYVGEAECHQFLADRGNEPSDLSVTIVRRLGRALNLEPNLPEAHAALAVVFFNEDNVIGSEAEVKRALELNPSLPDPCWLMFELAAIKGEPVEMVRQIEAAYRLDPIRPDFILRFGLAYLYTGREQEALEFWKKNEQLAPALANTGMTMYYLAKGNLEKAKELHAKAEQLDPTNPRVTWMGGAIAAMEGDRERAHLTIKKMENAQMGPVGFNFIAYVYHALGNLDAFFEYLNKAVEGHALIPTTLMYSPLFAKARNDPRYRELVEKLRKQCGLTK
jgi:TolB-like protein/Tfp pilus assembly protein PilF